MLAAIWLAWILPLSTGASRSQVQTDLSSQDVFQTNVATTKLHLSQFETGDTFTTLLHPSFPEYSLRIKQTDFCDPTVKVFTGYLDVDYGAKHMWFYFFESRSDPDKDDVVMWINGGPGCSSATGLLMELGPCSIDMKNSSSNGTLWNAYGWNNNANIFFLDQPVGVGFSYADFGEKIETTEDAAPNVASFLALWFEAFPQFKGRKLHLSGESYGGRYLPVFGSAVLEQNNVLAAAGMEPLNLESIIIGNGITDISTLYEGRYAVECGTASLDVPFQAISTCVRMKTALPRCQEGMKRNCIDSYDEMNCRASVAFCDYELSSAFGLSGRNPYDISKPCIGNDLCYEEGGFIQRLLNDPSTRDLLGVETTGNMTSCSEEVGRGFHLQFDKYKSNTQYYVAGLLDRGIRVLIYAGTLDWRCNWVANLLWTEKLEWESSEAYQSATMRDWKVDGGVAGQTKSAGKLTFATVNGAGHLVPHDKPMESLTMLNRWLKKQDM